METLSDALKKFELSLNDDVMLDSWNRGRLKEGWRADLNETRTCARFATLLERFYNNIDREESSDGNVRFSFSLVFWLLDAQRPALASIPWHRWPQEVQDQCLLPCALGVSARDNVGDLQ